MSEKETAAQTENVAEKAAQAAVTKKQPIKASDAETVIYIGPNSLSDGLKKYTVFRGRPTELIEAMAQKHKNISRLFVPVGKLNHAMAEAGKKGTPIYLAYSEVMEANK